jgi:Tol biopolymer transport system component
LIPIWSQDGSRIFYDSLDGRISAKPFNNTRPPEAIVDAIEGRPGRIAPQFLTPDGRALVFTSRGDIGMIPLDGKAPVSWLFDTSRFTERGATLSPDGKWMAYHSNESGRDEVYVSPFPNVGEDRVLISNAGGGRPLWSPDGKELFYIGGATRASLRLMSAAVESDGGKFKVVSRSPVWSTNLEGLHYFPEANTGRPIGISRDGQRFLVLKEVISESADRAPDRIFIVQNWTEELKRRVPGFLPGGKKPR